MDEKKKTKRSLVIWFVLWLVAFYSAWSFLVFGMGGWADAVAHWHMALAMAFGSYFAGSTPMGGGTVGFPVLVLLFDQPATLGRDFSLAVQSIGMTSASIFILCSRIKVDWTMLAPALLGSLIGTPVGLIWLAPHIPGLVIKLIFAVIWCSFGVLHLMKLNELASYEGINPAAKKARFYTGFGLGLMGGAAVASVTGVGIDMLIYTLLVLVWRADLRIAVPSSVILMAFTSLTGIATQNLLGAVQPGVYANWLAAAPVVALGAPFGAWIVSKMGRKPALLIVSALCLLQFVWTLKSEWAVLGITGVCLSVGAVFLFNWVFEWLHSIGKQLTKREADARLLDAQIQAAPDL